MRSSADRAAEAAIRAGLERGDVEAAVEETTRAYGAEIRSFLHLFDRTRNTVTVRDMLFVAKLHSTFDERLRASFARGLGNRAPIRGGSPFRVPPAPARAHRPRSFRTWAYATAVRVGRTRLHFDGDDGNHLSDPFQIYPTPERYAREPPMLNDLMLVVLRLDRRLRWDEIAVVLLYGEGVEWTEAGLAQEAEQLRARYRRFKKRFARPVERHRSGG